MVGIEQTENYVPAAIDRRRAHPTGRVKQNLLLRALILAFYIPVSFTARLLLNLTRFYGQARSISVSNHDIQLADLPPSFEELRVAFLTDFHCSAQTPASFLERVVMETNGLNPDLILLGGDYISEGDEYVPSIANVLRGLRAPLGVFGVMGNHDFDTDVEQVRAALKRAGVVELHNRGEWIERGAGRIRIAGVGDLWEDVQNVHGALGDAGPGDTVILLSHNPDYAMEITDPRVDLVLSGHTHGGQINLPLVGTVFSNSRYGKSLVSGLVLFQTFQLYVSRGLGTVAIPFRFNCPPEIALLRLKRKTRSN